MNLLSVIESAEKENSDLAVISLDLFKAYDRVNLTYLEKVMEAMAFNPTFISWVLLLHKGAKTRLLLSFVSDLIEVLFSVRQGDPLSMVLFIIYIEPLLLKICALINGYKLKAPLLSDNSEDFVVASTVKVEAYVDDTEVIATCDEDFILID